MPCIQRDYSTSPHHTLSSFCTLIVLLVTTHVHRALCSVMCSELVPSCYISSEPLSHEVPQPRREDRAGSASQLSPLQGRTSSPFTHLSCTRSSSSAALPWGWDAPEGSRDYWSTAHVCQPAPAHPVLLSLCESQ